MWGRGNEKKILARVQSFGSKTQIAKLSWSRNSKLDICFKKIWLYFIHEFYFEFELGFGSKLNLNFSYILGLTVPSLWNWVFLVLENALTFLKNMKICNVNFGENTF